MELSTLRLLCPKGCGELAFVEGWQCGKCGWIDTSRSAYLDMVGGKVVQPSGVGPRLMYSETLAHVYERLWRPMFVSFFGAGRSDLDAEFQAVRGALRKAKGEWIVDLSCGPGVMGRRLASCGDFRAVVGLDLSPPMLERAAHYIQRDETKMFLLIRADITNQPFADASMAGAHAGAALHLWPNVTAALEEIARTLRPGAPFVATTFFTSRRRLIGLGQRLAGRSIATRFFDEDWLRLELQRAGFENITLHRRAAYGFLTASRNA